VPPLLSPPVVAALIGLGVIFALIGALAVHWAVEERRIRRIAPPPDPAQTLADIRAAGLSREATNLRVPHALDRPNTTAVQPRWPLTDAETRLDNGLTRYVNHATKEATRR
jgi:hypothetical protein